MVRDAWDEDNEDWADYERVGEEEEETRDDPGFHPVHWEADEEASGEVAELLRLLAATSVN